MWVSGRRVEFTGELISEFGVEEVFDPVRCVVEMVARDIEMAGHVGLPKAVRSHELPGFGFSLVGEMRFGGCSPDETFSAQVPRGSPISG